MRFSAKIRAFSREYWYQYTRSCSKCTHLSIRLRRGVWGLPPLSIIRLPSHGRHRGGGHKTGFRGTAGADLPPDPARGGTAPPESGAQRSERQRHSFGYNIQSPVICFAIAIIVLVIPPPPRAAFTSIPRIAASLMMQ